MHDGRRQAGAQDAGPAGTLKDASPEVQAAVEKDRAAMTGGRDPIARYPPSAHPDVMRGEGCIMCPAFGVTCRGLELEWWNEWEWDEFDDRMSGG